MKRRPLSRIDEAYVAWLMAERGFNLQEALTYAKHGEDELTKLRLRGRPDPYHCERCRRCFDRHMASPHIPTARSQSERREARRADKPQDVRRWERVDQPCPTPGCQYPVHHSGPHKISHDLSEMLGNSIAALDARGQ